jgi:hypothetical protein
MARSEEMPVFVSPSITKGSIVVIPGEMCDEDEVPALMAQMRHAANHDRFLLVRSVEGVRVEVYGTEEMKTILREVVSELVKEALNAASQEAKAVQPGIVGGAGHGIAN